MIATPGVAQVALYAGGVSVKLAIHSINSQLGKAAAAAAALIAPA